MSHQILWAIPILFCIYLCYHIDTYTESFLRHRAQLMSRDELGDEILFTHAMGGNWQVFYAEWCNRGYEEYTL